MARLQANSDVPTPPAAPRTTMTSALRRGHRGRFVAQALHRREQFVGLDRLRQEIARATAHRQPHGFGVVPVGPTTISGGLAVRARSGQRRKIRQAVWSRSVAPARRGGGSRPDSKSVLAVAERCASSKLMSGAPASPSSQRLQHSLGAAGKNDFQLRGPSFGFIRSAWRRRHRSTARPRLSRGNVDENAGAAKSRVKNGTDRA